jgi:hypothetical protein
MADFDDITGWREELETFEATEEGKAYFGLFGPVGGPNVPFENVVQLAGLILRHEELYHALKKKVAWSDYTDTHPDLEHDDDEFWNLNPVDAHKTIGRFERWYGMKTMLPVNYRYFIVGVWLAFDIETGKLSSLLSSETAAHVRQQYSDFVSFKEDAE